MVSNGNIEFFLGITVSFFFTFGHNKKREQMESLKFGQRTLFFNRVGTSFQN